MYDKSPVEIEMCYHKLLYEYAHPANRWNDPYIALSEKRLRWLKYEAFGNTKFTATCFNIRRAHISNRGLQQKLGIQLSFYANTHGKQCEEIEFKQEKLWTDQSKREKRNMNRHHLRFATDSKSSRRESEQDQEMDRPFSNVKDYTVFRHIEARTVQAAEQVGRIHYVGRVSLLKFDRRKHKDTTLLTTSQYTALQSNHHISNDDSIGGTVGTVRPGRMRVVNGQYKKVLRQM